MTKSNGTANAERASKKRDVTVANGVSASAIENAVTSLIPRVDELERYFSGPLQGADATEKDAWLSACGGPRAPRSLAADAVLLETCYRLAGDRPEYDFLKAARARVELADGTITRSAPERRAMRNVSK